jgi:hypothetical protein
MFNPSFIKIHKLLQKLLGDRYMERHTENTICLPDLTNSGQYTTSISNNRKVNYTVSIILSET